jgi:hypothetical protein
MASRIQRSKIQWGIVGAVLLLYAVWLGLRFSATPSGSDASGYMNSARLLAGGHLTTPLRTVPELGAGSTYALVPLGFNAASATTLVPSYPIGVPLQLALASRLFGWIWGPYLVVIGGALGAIGLCYLIGRQCGVAPAWAFAGSGCLAVSAVFVFGSVQPFSDTLATFWCSLAFYSALRGAGGRTGWLAICAGSFVLAVLVRPPSVLVFPAVVIAIGRPRLLLRTAAIGLPLVLAVAAYQEALFGSPFQTGYGNVYADFHLANFGPTLRAYAVRLPLLLPLCLPAVVEVARRLRRGFSRPTLALTLWGVAFALFYAFYRYTRTDWSLMRYLEPALPAFATLGGLAMQDLWPAAPLRRRGLALALIAVSLAANRLAFPCPNARRHNERYDRAEAWLAREAPPGAVIVSMLFSGTVYYAGEHPILRWDLLYPNDARMAVAALTRSGRPIIGLLDDSEFADPRRARLPGTWSKLADFGGAGAWRLTPPTHP